ncbi:hypothetical protein D3C85_1524360 [compost metagenome]
MCSLLCGVAHRWAFMLYERSNAAFLDLPAISKISISVALSAMPVQASQNALEPAEFMGLARAS